MNDNRTSCNPDRPGRGSCVHRLLSLRAGLFLAVGLWASSPLPVAAATFEFTTASTTGTIQGLRQIVMRRSTSPLTQNFYYYNGNQWISTVVGPGKTDLILVMAAGVNYPLSPPPVTWEGLGGPVSTFVEGTIPRHQITVALCATLAAQTQGPIIYAVCDFNAQPWKATKATTGSNSKTFIQTPPVYLDFYSVEGQLNVIIDNGAPIDTDGDGQLDSVDEDDDGDGRPDASDDFPLNPNEKDDFDEDGTGNNADLDDDNDGTPDATDDLPYDPTGSQHDDDGDGVGDATDLYPQNSKESADSDGDGIGNNQDPDDNTPKVTGPSGGLEFPTWGDGSGNPGTGDGGGGLGPIPLPGATGTDTGAAGVGDTRGEVLPGASHDVAGKALSITPAIQSKLGNFNPLSSSAIPRATSASIAFSNPRFGSFDYTIDFTKSPWTHMRTLLFLIMLYLTGRALLKRFTV